jgi:hypothetical protein
MQPSIFTLRVQVHRTSNGRLERSGSTPAAAWEFGAPGALMRLSSCYRWRALVLVLLLLFVFASLVALPSAATKAQATQAGKVHRIGFLRAGPPPKPWVEALQQGLRERGYIDGQNVVIEFRSTVGSLDQLPQLADELVRLKVDRCHPGFVFASGCGRQEGDHDGADRLCERVRSARAWTHLKPGTPGRQHHGTDRDLC